MNAPPAALSKDVTRVHEEIRGSELGAALKRERLLKRVRAARKRLPQTPSSVLARIRECAKIVKGSGRYRLNAVTADSPTIEVRPMSAHRSAQGLPKADNGGYLVSTDN